MANCHRKYEGTPLMLYGNKVNLDASFLVLDDLNLTGDSTKDCLLIQDALDEGRIKADCLYDGRRVYPYKKLVKEFKKCIQRNSIEGMSKLMYDFLYLNFDIAHYDYHGYIDYYDGKWNRLWEETLQMEFQRPYGFLPSTKRIVSAIRSLLKGEEVLIEEKRNPTKKSSKQKAQGNRTGFVQLSVFEL